MKWFFVKKQSIGIKSKTLSRKREKEDENEV
jgi:hypothetical protein